MVATRFIFRLATDVGCFRQPNALLFQNELPAWRERRRGVVRDDRLCSARTRAVFPAAANLANLSMMFRASTVVVGGIPGLETVAPR